MTLHFFLSFRKIEKIKKRKKRKRVISVPADREGERGRDSLNIHEIKEYSKSFRITRRVNIFFIFLSFSLSYFLILYLPWLSSISFCFLFSPFLLIFFYFSPLNFFNFASFAFPPRATL